ncbi:hypothetical protein SAMN05444156_3241 [Verrucomicrobium sp. GAS474]|uniref:hypothetical protein n=1 Tax=Verrucomicrobium sp. GAS474 TaxID=1882831 RepID=UPI000879B264|nr:hypothetical protein [Verrucomicrobium sp. GAS474]SDU31445.1 hypothetical protein SAMN05444156_3241 [Verrucomicrobium sp. GAS474]
MITIHSIDLEITKTANEIHGLKADLERKTNYIGRLNRAKAALSDLDEEGGVPKTPAAAPAKAKTARQENAALDSSLIRDKILEVLLETGTPMRSVDIAEHLHVVLTHDQRGGLDLRGFKSRISSLLYKLGHHGIDKDIVATGDRGRYGLAEWKGKGAL